MAYLLGSAGKVYWGLVGTDDLIEAEVATDAAFKTAIDDWHSPTGPSEAGNVMDVTINVDAEFVDATTRSEASQGFASRINVLNGGQVTFDMRWDTVDLFFTELQTAWKTKVSIPIWFSDKEIAAGAQGLAANWSVGFNIQQPLRDVQKVSVTLEIASWPIWHVRPA